MLHNKHSKQRNFKQLAGMTLIELMIVLVIVGILAALGYPAYVDYADRARRSDGKSMLLDAAARQERYYFDNNRYTATLTELGYGSGTVNSGEGNYVLTAGVGATNNIVTSFTVTATPVATFNDPKCNVLTLDSRGTQTENGTESLEYCWGR